MGGTAAVSPPHDSRGQSGVCGGGQGWMDGTAAAARPPYSGGQSGEGGRGQRWLYGTAAAARPPYILKQRAVRWRGGGRHVFVLEDVCLCLKMCVWMGGIAAVSPPHCSCLCSLVTGQCSVLSGHWSLVSIYWSVFTGHWSLVCAHWSLVIGQCSLVTSLLSRSADNILVTSEH